MQLQELSDADADKQGELKGQAQDAPWPKRIPRLVRVDKIRSMRVGLVGQVLRIVLQFQLHVYFSCAQLPEVP